MKYFAYGSNMNHLQMMSRCPGNLFLGKGLLINYTLIFDGNSKKRKGAVANISKINKGEVWGGLYEINGDNLAILDRFEKGYERDYFKILIDNKLVEAIVYFRNSLEKGFPSQEYLDIIVEGAVNCKLPKRYINNLRAVNTL